MGRPKTYDKRFHFNGPSALAHRAQAIAALRTTGGVPTRSSDILREALAAGLDALETCARSAHETPDRLGADQVTEVLDDLGELGDAISRLDLDAIRALGDLDVEVLKAMRYLDPEVLDALASLDASALTRLESTADELSQICDSVTFA